MKLELGFIRITDIQFAKVCKVENGVLYVDPEALRAYLYEDDDIRACVKAIEFDIARPGEIVRITPVKDVIEPRVKVEGPGGEFPGVISKVETVSFWFITGIVPNSSNLLNVVLKLKYLSLTEKSSSVKSICAAVKP